MFQSTSGILTKITACTKRPVVLKLMSLGSLRVESGSREELGRKSCGWKILKILLF